MLSICRHGCYISTSSVLFRVNGLQFSLQEVHCDKLRNSPTCHMPCPSGIGGDSRDFNSAADAVSRGSFPIRKPTGALTKSVQ